MIIERFQGRIRDFPNEAVKRLALTAPLHGFARKVIGKYRIQRLRKGEVPTAHLDWHYDTVRDKDARGAELHHLWISSPWCLTEFEDRKIQAKTWITYGRVLHRPTPALQDGVRLILRVDEIQLP